MANSYGALATFKVDDQTINYYRLEALRSAGLDISRLPFSLKILLENLLRHEDGVTVTPDDIKALANWDPKAAPDREIAFRPSRVRLQDFTGVPCIVDLAAMRDARTPRWNSSATASDMPSCAGGKRPSTISGSCRPTRVSFTR